MPFRLNAQELSAASSNGAVLSFVRRVHPDSFDSFIESSGKTEKEWLDTSSGTHQACLYLVAHLYALTKNRDPHQLLEVYSELGRSSNPITTIARILGSPMLAFGASAKFTQFLNKDSSVRALGGKDGRSCVVQHTVLGDMSTMYYGQVLGTVGYYEGMKHTFAIDDFTSRVRLVQMQLRRILENDYGFLNLGLSFDDEGNLYDSSRNRIARRILFGDTTFMTTNPESDYPHPLYRIRETKTLDDLVLSKGTTIVGSVANFPGIAPDILERLQLENLRLLEVEKNLDFDGVRILTAGEIYGGEDPAPASIYDFSWKVNRWRYSLAAFVSRALGVVSRSPRLIENLTQAAQEESEKRVELEQQVEAYSLDLASRTSVEQELVTKRDKLKLEVREHLHDVARNFERLREQSFLGYVYFIDALFKLIPAERSNAFLKEINIKVLSYQPISSLEDLCSGIKGSVLGEDVENTIDLSMMLDIIPLVQEFIPEEVQPQYRSLLGWFQNIKNECSGYSEGARNIMVSLDPEPYKPVSLRKTLEAVRSKQSTLLEHIQFRIAGEGSITSTDRTMALLFENIVVNAWEASRRLNAPYVDINIVEEEKLKVTVRNPVDWSSEDNMRGIIEQMNNRDPSRRFSTKEDLDNKGKRGGGLSYIKSQVYGLGGSYCVEGSFEDKSITQVLEFNK